MTIPFVRVHILQRQFLNLNFIANSGRQYFYYISIMYEEIAPQKLNYIFKSQLVCGGDDF